MIYVIDFVFTGAHAKVRGAVIFRKCFMRSTSQNPRIRLFISFRGWFFKQNNYKTVLTIFLWLNTSTYKLNRKYGFTFNTNIGTERDVNEYFSLAQTSVAEINTRDSVSFIYDPATPFYFGHNIFRLYIICLWSIMYQIANLIMIIISLNVLKIWTINNL